MIQEQQPARNLPLYRRIAENLQRDILEGVYPPDKALPSLRAMAIKTGYSRETLVTAYRYLCRKGVLSSIPGKGYFVRAGFLSGKQSVLVLLDKFSPHQQSVMDALTDTLGDQADVTVLMHYQDLDRLSAQLDTHLERYDWYIVFPHFPLEEAARQRAATLLRRIPAHKLIAVDRKAGFLPPECGVSYQSIEEDIPAAMKETVPEILSFGRMRYSSLSVSLYGNLVGRTIQSFCESNHIPFDTFKDMPDTIEKGDIFFVSGSRLDRKLLELIQAIQARSLTIGKDVGLICYNDFPLNKLILGGLTTLSTDFSFMGRAVAEMILSRQLSSVHCPCRLIRRNTF